MNNNYSKENETKKEKQKTIIEKFSDDLSENEKNNLYMLIGIVLLLMIIAFFLKTYFDSSDAGGSFNPLYSMGLGSWYKSTYPDISNSPSHTLVILVGMVSGFVFGFIDNAGLFFGMDSLDPIFELAGMNNLEKAGWGNTFSDFIGAFLGAAVGSIFKALTGVEETPFYTEFIGIIIGCIAGIYIPQAIKESS